MVILYIHNSGMDSCCRPPTSSLLGGRRGNSTSPSPSPFSASSPNDHGCRVPARFHRRLEQKLRLSRVLYLPFLTIQKYFTFDQEKFYFHSTYRQASLFFGIFKIAKNTLRTFSNHSSFRQPCNTW
jgi:hypothetical protein